MYSAFYLTPNGTNLFLESLISFIIGDTNQAFLRKVGEDLSKDTAMDIMEGVNLNENTSTEGFEEADYVGKIPTAVTAVINELTGADPGSTAKGMKTFVTPDMETI